jgi:hypothetical protein
VSRVRYSSWSASRCSMAAAQLSRLVCISASIWSRFSIRDSRRGTNTVSIWSLLKSMLA